MNVLVDTCVWSLALRRHQAVEDAFVAELRELIAELRVRMIGPIRQELLSGVRSSAQFSNLRDRLRAFPDLELNSEDFEKAAEFFNLCRAKGIQGSNTDFLICAVAERLNMTVLTTDGDFELFQQAVPVKLHQLRQ